MTTSTPTEGGSGRSAYRFRIFIAGGAPNSVQALANLYAICQKHFAASHRIEVVDILKDPLRALAEGILVTPTVVKLAPAPELQIIGNLSDEAEVLRALGLPQNVTCFLQPTTTRGTSMTDGPCVSRHPEIVLCQSRCHAVDHLGPLC